VGRWGLVEREVVRKSNLNLGSVNGLGGSSLKKRIKIISLSDKVTEAFFIGGEFGQKKETGDIPTNLDRRKKEREEGLSVLTNCRGVRVLGWSEGHAGPSDQKGRGC